MFSNRLISGKKTEEISLSEGKEEQRRGRMPGQLKTKYLFKKIRNLQDSIVTRRRERTSEKMKAMKKCIICTY